MKSFFIENLEIIEITSIVVFLLSFLFLLFISYVINKDNYTEIVKLYEQQFGQLPLTARMSKNASLIGTPSAYHAKIGFIMGSLIFPYNRVTNHDMSIEAYNFIRHLPRELTFGFKIEAALWVISISAMAIAMCSEAFI